MSYFDGMTVSSAKNEILLLRRKGKIGVGYRQLAVSAIFLFFWKVGGETKKST